jgi:GT2 family glycosyltransferase/glycosyltransferase involved in cell wall biosynthesis/organic radical activating enzyme
MPRLNTQNTPFNPPQLPTVLMIDATLPTYDQDSGSLRLFNLIKMLVKMGYKVTFFPDKKHPSHLKYQYALEALGVEVFMGTINECLSSRPFTLAWLCRVHIAHHYIPFFRLLSQDTKIFYDTVDIHYLRELRQAEIENNPRLAEQARNTKRKELSSCMLANHVITVTEEDGNHLQKELPQLTFSVIPNIHTNGVQSFAVRSFVPFTQREGLIFIGHYRHKPNQDAVYYFVDTVLPKIHVHLPDVKLYLVGSAMPEKMKALASTHIKIIGWVEQVEPEFAQRRVFVSPLRYGSGMKGKLGQALSLGLPVVTTTIGAEGMGLIDGETALIADDPDSFAEAVCRLYRDPSLWEKLSHQGQAFIEQHYGAATVYEKLRDLLDTYKLLPTVPVSPVFEDNLPVPALTLPKFVDTFALNPIQLPDAPIPRVSIVIPVFNKVLYTYNCLLTVQACDLQINKEVIIINNASTDETAALLEQLQGAFTVINNSENQGFVQACRQGAEVASGEFILFLNNDTQVMPGWLSNMLKVMDTDAKVGITGSKLIYPDGRLQEAGGIIFNDGSGYNYGRSQNPLLPQFNQSREVDYCSGASLMIRKTLWEQLGGFDLRYAPAYYEDTDLCFAARQAGYKVFYCHDSEVVHHEGITAGTDINTGYKAFQAVNRKKFQDKWRDILSTHPPPQSSQKAQTLRYAQIEMITICNQRCYFCPISVARRPKNKLSLDKLDKILTELRAYPIETISIAGFSEPTYDKQIVEKVVSIRKAGFTVLFYTNGSGLKPALIDELLKAGVSRFTINLSTLDETQYEQTRGTKDIKHIIPYIDYLLAQVQGQTHRVEVILIMLGALDRQHGTNIQRITKQFAYSQVVRFSISPLGNYAGETMNFRVLPEPIYHKTKTLRGCAREYQNQWLHVTAQGEVILCCQDYHAKYQMGHIDDATVTQIYQGEKITQWRRWISGAEEAPEDFICRYCLFALTGGDSYAKRLQKLFCQSCVLPSMLGIENACRRCEVNSQLEKRSPNFSLACPN